MPTATHRQRSFRPGLLIAAIGGLLSSTPVALGQDASVEGDLGAATHVVMPQRRAWAVHRHAPQDHNTVAIESIAAHVRIMEHTASTTLNISTAQPQFVTG